MNTFGGLIETVTGNGQRQTAETISVTDTQRRPILYLEVIRRQPQGPTSYPGQSNHGNALVFSEQLEEWLLIGDRDKNFKIGRQITGEKVVKKTEAYIFIPATSQGLKHRMQKPACGFYSQRAPSD